MATGGEESDQSFYEEAIRSPPVNPAHNAQNVNAQQAQNADANAQQEQPGDAAAQGNVLNVPNAQPAGNAGEGSSASSPGTVVNQNQQPNADGSPGTVNTQNIVTPAGQRVVPPAPPTAQVPARPLGESASEGSSPQLQQGSGEAGRIGIVGDVLVRRDHNGQWMRYFDYRDPWGVIRHMARPAEPGDIPPVESAPASDGSGRLPRPLTEADQA